jgi:hypothetical protein
LTFFNDEENGEVQDTTLEGKVTRILYYLPEGHSVLQVQRNYQMALKEAGFEMVYECFGGIDKIPGEIYRNFEPIGGRKNRNIFN